MLVVSTGESETVCSIAAQIRSSSLSTAETSALQTKSRLPAVTTSPRATRLSPRAGARKFTLYSTVSTSLSGGARVRAAYPPALSPIAPITAP